VTLYYFDGSWVEFYSHYTGYGDIILTFPEVQTSKIKMVCNDIDWEIDCSMSEVEVWGMPVNLKISYLYDAAGNRTDRLLTLNSTPLTKSGSIYNAETDSLKKDYEPKDIFNDQVGESKITIYPNPTSGQLVVKLEGQEEGIPVSLKVYSLGGKLVFNRDHAGIFTNVDISGNPPGIYILKIKAGDKSSEWKIIKK
jgi:hypothetical protein